MQLSFQRRILIGIYFIKSLSNDWISSLVRINTDRVIGKQINDLTLFHGLFRYFFSNEMDFLN